MLKSYLLIALRTIRKHRTFSFINIFGLAVGMMVCMTIIMLVADQMMMDRHNPNSDRIYRVTSIPYYKENNGIPGNESATVPMPLRDELISNYTGVESAVRLRKGFGNYWIDIEPSHDVNIPISGFFADQGVLELFNLELLYGDPSTALIEPYSVVLTKAAAEKLFKVENPVGESLKVGKFGTYKVTGVIKQTDNRSHIVAEAYASIATVKSLEAAHVLEGDMDNWYNYFQGWVYILLEEGKTIKDVEPALAKISAEHYAQLPNEETAVVKFSYQNLLDIVPGRMLNNPIGPFMPWMIVYFMAGLAGIVLITSCFNFTNLSIARSLGRAREIGVRKVTGAVRWQIFVQFLSESVVIAVFALVLAIAMLFLLKPMVEELAFAKVLRWNLSANYVVYIVFFVLAVVVGIIAGLFPAGVLSGFQPIAVLKNLGNSKLMSKIGLRKALLVIQFALSMIFILTVIVLYNQINLFMHNDNGFSVENKYIINKGSTSIDQLKIELLKQPNVTSVSATSHVPLAGISFGDGFKKSLDEKDWKEIPYFSVDEDYVQNMELSLVAGKFYSADAGTSNSNFIILNEAAVKSLNYSTPLDAIGQVLITQSDSTEKQILGVVKDYHHELFSDRLGPLSLLYNKDEFKLLQVNYTGDYKQAAKNAEQVWATINPGLKVEVKEFKAEMGELYRIVFGTLIKVLGFIAFLAIVISCLGLLGMATYTIETRKKEIAMRKILGSSDGSLIYLLSKGYLSILIIALLIAIPAAYFINTAWLESMAYHVNVDFVTILLGVLVLAFFGLFTIGSQTIQATYVKPIDNLKRE